MNIIVVVIDTLRYDYIRANGSDFIETPNMDRLAAESLNFDFTFSNSYPTIPHRTDLITGQYGEPFHLWMPLPFDWPALPNLLRENGYCTQLIHDTPHLVNGGHNFDWPFNAWTFVRGGEVDRPWIDSRTDWPDNWFRDPDMEAYGEKDDWSNLDTYTRANRKRRTPEDWNCHRLFSKASEFLSDNRNRDNFFLWVDSFDPHEPWDAPAEFMLKYDKTPGADGRIDPRWFGPRNDPNLPETVKERIKASYAAKVSWVDHCLGMMLDTLEQTGLSRNTTIILTADHGTNVGERGRFGKGHPIHEQEARVPLMIRLPGGPNGRSDRIAQPQDIFSTILNIAAAENMVSPPGIDLLDPNSPRRMVALAGRSASSWNESWHGSDVLFTVFDRDWYLLAKLTKENSVLVPMGDLSTVQDLHPDVVERLYALGLEELKRRGTAPELLDWIHRHGEGVFPENVPCYRGYPAPKGYYAYFQNVYHE